MTTHFRALLPIVFLILACVARGQSTEPDDSLGAEAFSVRALKERLAALSESDTVAADIYRDAILRMERAVAANVRAADARASSVAAPTQLAAIREELAKPSIAPQPSVPDGATLAQLEQGEAQANAQLGSARNSLTDLQAEYTRRQERRGQVPESLARMQQRLIEIENLLFSPPDVGSGTTAVARRLALFAEKAELDAETAALQAELSNYDSRRDLLPARRDREARRVAEYEQLVRSWGALVSARRMKEADNTAREAARQRRETARKHPVLQEFAAETQRLAEQRTGADGIPAKITRVSKEAVAAGSRFADLKQRYLAVRQRITASGLNRATGLLLRREYETLPDTSALRRRTEGLHREIEDVEYILFERQQNRVGSDDIGQVVADLLDGIDPSASETGDSDIEAAATELATARRDVLAELDGDANRYQEVLLQASLASDELLEAALAYEAYIKERILWVRSIANDSESARVEFRKGLAWLSDQTAWSEAIRRVRQDLSDRLSVRLVQASMVIMLFVVGHLSRRRLRTVAELIRRYRSDRFRHTVRALVLTTLAAAPLPAFLWLLGGVLSQPVDQVPVAGVGGEALRAGAILLFPLQFVLRAAHPCGLAIAHFRWPETVVRTVQKKIRQVLPVFVPTAAVVVALDSQAADDSTKLIARLLFTIAMLTLAYFLARIARPRGELSSAIIGWGQDGWIDRLRHPLYLIVLGVPVTLVVLAWLGYFYTAMQLELRMELTVALFLALGLVNGLLARWLFLARRRVAVEDARRRREQTIAEAEAGLSPESGPTESSIPPIDEDSVNLPGISLQTRQLFRASIWIAAGIGLIAIWADVLPALKVLDRIEIYPSQRVLDTHDDDSIPIFETGNGKAAAVTSRIEPSGNPTNPTTNGITEPIQEASAEHEIVEKSITLADVGFAVVVLAGTFIAFRNLPGLIEIVVLQRLPLDAGSRFALSTVLRYTIVVLGLVAAFGAMDIAWSNVQWLAAALTFGLGFGLQEIFANFISGLIILAERPIRIGDTVTVGSTSGTVTRIRMRATTITDWERKEMVIPNKTFITGDIINWSLSDPILRLTIPVGVGYGSDVRQTEEVLRRVAIDQPNVLSDPKPYVVFGGFGDSTLDFQLRVFIPHIDHFVTVRHDLNMRIIEAFRAANIEIAFPQRDLHIRSVGDLTNLSVVR